MRSGQRRGLDARVARGAQRQARERRDTQARRHESLDRDEVVGGERDLRAEAGQLALPDQVAAAPLAAADPPVLRIGGQVRPGWQRRLVGQGPGRMAVRTGRGGPGHQVDGIVEEQPGPGALVRVAGRARGRPVLVVPEHQRHVHVAGPEHAQGFRRLSLGQREVQAGILRLEPGRGHGYQRAERRRERGQPDPACPQAHVRGELVLRGIQPAQDLLGPFRQQPAGVGQPDPAAGPLGQQRPGLGLEPGQVMAYRGLGVVEGPGRSGHRAVPGHRDEHAEPGHIQHSAIIDPLDLTSR